MALKSCPKSNKSPNLVTQVVGMSKLAINTLCQLGQKSFIVSIDGFNRSQYFEGGIELRGHKCVWIRGSVICLKICQN